jgi:hypothetical protein
MYKGKLRYIERLAPKFSSVKFGKTIDGSSPPGVFIGRKNYPKVFAGPLVTGQKGDTSQLDTPENWLGTGMNAVDIAAFRMQLARGMQQVEIQDLENKIVAQMRDIALASKSIDANAEFEKEPKGYSFNEHHQPFGPSALLKSIEISAVRYQHDMEKAYFDTDLAAGEALTGLYEKGLLVSQLQKALSVGAFGLGKRRKMVPTRWSITAVDDTLGNALLEGVKNYEPIGEYRLYTVHRLNNKFCILLTPTTWKYESMEAFFPQIIGDRLEIYSDYEYYDGRSDYAQIGGCYYSAKLAVLEQLEKEKKQAGCIILRECYSNYVPLGVWNVRENVRLAMQSRPEQFESMKDVLRSAENKLVIPISRWIEKGHVLRESMTQTRISDFSSKKIANPSVS